MTTADQITAECNAIKAMLLDKNARYGDSAMHPRRIFSRADHLEQLKMLADWDMRFNRNDDLPQVNHIDDASRLGYALQPELFPIDYQNICDASRLGYALQPELPVI